ncbi:MAG: VOC family protein [Tumebacillaceae bacterium]
MIKELTPFLLMDGNAKEAIHFYEKTLDAKVVFFQTFGEGPQDPDAPIPVEFRDRVAHAVLQVGEAVLMVADKSPGLPHGVGNQVTILIATDDVEHAKRLYEALQQDGEVNMPLTAVHFSPAYGMVTDKFGVMLQVYTKPNR